MVLLKFGIVMVVMSVYGALETATLILKKEDKIAYKEWRLNPKRPTSVDIKSEKFPLTYMMGCLFRLLFLVGAVCIIVSIFLK
ncbi:hypothetical protein [Pseudomonas batumici]|uniref:hypothetical protein n=1 Tax=Pseudomonas batumici TaxID=226910 RepID=UPI000589D38D|nr:hypothetical protein [Pseudomonas batumici]